MIRSHAESKVQKQTILQFFLAEYKATIYGIISFHTVLLQNLTKMVKN